MNTKTSTSTQQVPKNSVADLVLTLKQADQLSIVRDENGRPVTAYINPVTREVAIVADG